MNLSTYFFPHNVYQIIKDKEKLLLLSFTDFVEWSNCVSNICSAKVLLLRSILNSHSFYNNLTKIITYKVPYATKSSLIAFKNCINSMLDLANSASKLKFSPFTINLKGIIFLLSHVSSHFTTKYFEIEVKWNF